MSENLEKILKKSNFDVTAFPSLTLEIVDIFRNDA
jgi:hypothetical protein